MQQVPAPQRNKVAIAGKVFKVEIAIGLLEQSRGLSGRKALKKGEGMLFGFSIPQRPVFHMRGMKFPIDIIWISKELKVIGTEKDAKPWTTFFGKLYMPPSLIKYALEVSSGEGTGIRVGDQVSF